MKAVKFSTKVAPIKPPIPRQPPKSISSFGLRYWIITMVPKVLLYLEKSLGPILSAGLTPMIHHGALLQRMRKCMS